MLKTVSTANGLVSPTFSGNVTLSNGNLVIGTSGKGIDFSATPGTGTSELFADYEEGAFTPSFTNLTTVGTLTTQGRYTRIGRMVYICLTVAATTSTASTSNSTFFTGLPFSLLTGFSSTVTAVGNANVASYGVGLIDTSNAVYTPTWSSGAAQTITVAGFYITT